MNLDIFVKLQFIWILNMFMLPFVVRGSLSCHVNAHIYSSGFGAFRHRKSSVISNRPAKHVYVDVKNEYNYVCNGTQNPVQTKCV